MKRWCALFVLASMGLAGCNGGQSGGELGGDGSGGSGTGTGGTTGNTTEDDNCDESSTSLTTEETSPLGFAPSDILAFAAGTHEATLVYLPDSEQGAQVNLTPTSEESALTVVIEPKGTAAYVSSSPAERGGGPQVAMDFSESCEDYVAIDVTVTVTTEDGAYDETIDGTLKATTSSQAHLNAPLDLDDLNGTLEVEVLWPEGGTTAPAQLTATFGPGLFVGQIAGAVEKIGAELAVASFVTYGEWGYGSCEAGQAPATTTGALAPDAILGYLNGSSPLDVTWAGADTVDLALTFGSSGELCAELENDLTGEAMGYLLPAELELVSSDGRLQTTLPVRVRATGTEEALDTLTVEPSSLQFVEPDDFEATYGMTGVQLDAHTDIFLRIYLSYDVGASTVSGSLSVMGTPPTTCVDTPNSACGSPGSQTIESAPVSSP